MKKTMIAVILFTMMLIVLVPLKSVARTRKTVTVAVIDTGIDKELPNLCRFGHKSFVQSSKDPLQDDNGHGTHIAGLINANAGVDNYCLVSIKYYSDSNSGHQNLVNLEKALRYAINIKVNFINISGGGPESFPEEKALIKEALDKGIKVVVAAGNEKLNLDEKCNYYPACYDKRLVVVGNLQITKDYRGFNDDMKFLVVEAGMGNKIGTYETERAPSSDYGNVVNRWEIGTDVRSTLPGGQFGYKSGTSQATAIATGKLVREILKK